MTAPAQLAFPTDPLRDDLRPAERAAVEARVQDEDDHRADRASEAQHCRCTTPWGIGTHCMRCGRDVRRATA